MKFVIEKSGANKLNSGFTLIELMVTVGIFVFMTALLLAKYNSYYSGTIFKNQAYDVAITLRQAQSFGISVKADPGQIDNPRFDAAYGVKFPGTNVTGFELRAYGGTPPNFVEGALEKDYKLKYGAYFSQLILTQDGSSNPAYADSAFVVFQRPNPEAIICARVNGTLTCNAYKYLELVMKSQDNKTKSIKINSSGQISIIES